MKNNLFISVLVLLAGCATDNPPIAPPLTPLTTTVVLPPQLLEDCANLAKLDKPSYTEGELIKVIDDWSKTNTACKANHKALVDTIKQAFNIDPVTHIATPVTK